MWRSHPFDYAQGKSGRVFTGWKPMILNVLSNNPSTPFGMVGLSNHWCGCLAIKQQRRSSHQESPAKTSKNTQSLDIKGLINRPENLRLMDREVEKSIEKALRQNFVESLKQIL